MQAQRSLLSLCMYEETVDASSAVEIRAQAYRPSLFTRPYFIRVRIHASSFAECLYSCRDAGCVLLKKWNNQGENTGMLGYTGTCGAGSCEPKDGSCSLLLMKAGKKLLQCASILCGEKVHACGGRKATPTVGCLGTVSLLIGIHCPADRQYALAGIGGTCSGFCVPVPGEVEGRSRLAVKGKVTVGGRAFLGEAASHGDLAFVCLAVTEVARVHVW